MDSKEADLDQSLATAITQIRQARREVLLMPLDVDQLRRSITEAENNIGVSLEQLREALRT